MASQLLADIVLVVHFAFVAFVVGGLAAIWVGAAAGWRWVRNPWFRWIHLIAIGVVVVQAWLGVICPLTTWESALRARGGDATYEGSFIAHWLNELLYFQAPAWVFTLCYSLFGALVLASWFLVRPRSVRRR